MTLLDKGIPRGAVAPEGAPTGAAGFSPVPAIVEDLRQGRLAAVSGKMVKQSPESMKIRTPSAIMGVRGTEFVVQVDEAPASAKR